MLQLVVIQISYHALDQMNEAYSSAPFIFITLSTNNDNVDLDFDRSLLVLLYFTELLRTWFLRICFVINRF
jgi:hypothetical protein